MYPLIHFYIFFFLFGVLSTHKHTHNVFHAVLFPVIFSEAYFNLALILSCTLSNDIYNMNNAFLVNVEVFSLDFVPFLFFYYSPVVFVV